MTTAASSRQIRLKRYQWAKFLAFFGVIFFSLIIMIAIRNLLLSAVIAFVLSYLLSPMVNAVERMGLRRILSILVVFGALTLVFGIAIAAMAPFLADQVASFKTELPKYIEGITSLMIEIEQQVEVLSGNTYSINLSDKVEGYVGTFSESLFQDLPSLLSQSLTILLMAPLFAFFMLKDGRSVHRSLMGLVPNSFFELTLNLYYQIDDQMGQFIRARILEAVIVGLVVWAGLSFISFKYAFLLASFAALANLIPYIGPFIGIIPALFIALINGDSGFEITLMLSVYFIAQLIDIIFIIPLVVAKIVDLHPLTVLLSIVVGAELLGVLGMLISIPVASALKVTLTSVYHHLTDFRV